MAIAKPIYILKMNSAYSHQYIIFSLAIQLLFSILITTLVTFCYYTSIKNLNAYHHPMSYSQNNKLYIELCSSATVIWETFKLTFLLVFSFKKIY